MGRSLLRIRLPCPRLCHPPLDPRLGAQGVLPPVPLARPTSHERAGIAAAQNGRARGQSLTTTQSVLLQSDCHRSAVRGFARYAKPAPLWLARGLSFSFSRSKAAAPFARS